MLKLKGKNINLDIKKLSGEWEGYYRVRKGRLRIIFEPNKNQKLVFVEKIDFRAMYINNHISLFPLQNGQRRHLDRPSELVKPE